MPHLIIEYSNNVPNFDAETLLRECNQTLNDSGQFEEIDIKSRAFPVDTFAVGVEPAGRAFIALRLALLSGRSPEIKRDLSRRLMDSVTRNIRQTHGIEVQITVELQDMERDSFLKTFIKN